MSAPGEAPSGSSGVTPAWVGPVQPGVAQAGPAPTGPAVWSPAVAPGAGLPRRAPVAPPRKASAVRSSTMSFGIVGKTVITVVLLAVGGLVAFGNLFGVPVYLVFLVWVLRDLWTRERRAAAPRRPSTQVRTVAPATYGDVPRSAPPGR